MGRGERDATPIQMRRLKLSDHSRQSVTWKPTSASSLRSADNTEEPWLNS